MNGTVEVAPAAELRQAPPATPMVRHVVERKPDGSYQDKCLCGYVWDRLHVTADGPLCEECYDVLKARGLVT